MAAATARTQSINFELVRSGRLSPTELALMTIIYSYSDHCALRQQELAKMMSRSVTTIKRIVNSLIEKGVITKRHTLFKRCVLKLVPQQQQRELITGRGAIRQVFKVINKKKHQEPHPIVQKAKQALKMENKRKPEDPQPEKEKLVTTEDYIKKPELTSSRLSETFREKAERLQNEKQRQLAAFSQWCAEKGLISSKKDDDWF